MSTYKLFDVVALLGDSKDEPQLREGAEGYVVHIIEPDGLFVEFLDKSSPGDTIAVLSLSAGDVKLVRAAESTVAHTNPILIDPEIMQGTPCFEGTQVPVSTLFDFLGSGNTLDTFLHNCPTVAREQAIAALEVMREAVGQHAKYVDPMAGCTAEERAAFDRELQRSIEEGLAGRVITMEDSLADVRRKKVPDTIVPRKGGILAALRRSPLVGEDVIVERGVYADPKDDQ